MNRFLLLFLLILPFYLYPNDLSNGLNDESGRVYLLKARDLKDLVVYDSSEYFYQKSVEIFAYKKEWDSYVVAQIELGNLNRIQGKTDAAKEILDDVYFNKEFNLKDYPNEYAEYLHLKGTLVGDYGEFELAISALDSVVSLRRSISNSDTLLAKTFNNLGAYYYFLDQSNKALELYEKALNAELAKKNPKPEDVASYYQNIGTIYSLKGDYDRALVFFNKNLELNKIRLNTNDPEIADIYYNLAVNYRRLGQFNNALRYIKAAEKIFMEYENDYSALGYIYIAIGGIYFDKLDYDNAEIYYYKVMNIYKSHLKSTHSNLLHIYFRLGVIAKIKENYTLALEYYNKCLPLTKTVNYAYRLRDIASIYHLMNETDKVNENISLAIEKINNDFEGSKSSLADMLHSNARYLLDNNRVQEAKYLINEVIKINSDFSSKKIALSKNYNLLAKIYLALNAFDLAFVSYEKALELNNPKLQETNSIVKSGLNKVYSEMLYLELLLGKADVLARLYFNIDQKPIYLNSSIKNYQSALEVFEDMKSYAGESSKLNISRLNKREFDKIYLGLEELFDLTSDSKYLELAFKFAEKFKASLLLSSIKETEAIKFGGIPEDLQELEKVLDQRISGYQRLIYDENNGIYPDSSKIAIWEENLFYVNHEYNQLIDSFQMHYADYYSLNFNKDVISIAEVQNHIEEDQLLIDYKMTDTLLFTITINKDTTKFFKTKIDSSFYNNLKILEGLAHTDFANHRMKDFNDFVNASNSLYNNLLHPIFEDIEDKRLIIVPDGRLGYLPFETLITELPKEKRMDYRNLAYLIKENPISYTYSSTLLYRNYKEPDSEMDLLAFAPQYDPFSEEEMDKPTERGLFFMPLMNAITEVENISDIYSGDVFLNEDATELKFKEVAEDYDIIHLAMHTVIDDIKPMYSKLVFSNSSDSTEDRYLNTYELYGLELKAKMAVLSACNTGSGKIEEGEGIMSLARGFIYAGVPSIVMTLWEVEDKSGADIMTLFYKKLKEGLPKDIALQQAKLEYLKSATQLRSHPYFWLAYVDIGNTKPFKKSTFRSEISYSIIIVFILIFGAILRNRHKKKSTA